MELWAATEDNRRRKKERVIDYGDDAACLWQWESDCKFSWVALHRVDQTRQCYPSVLIDDPLAVSWMCLIQHFVRSLPHRERRGQCITIHTRAGKG